MNGIFNARFEYLPVGFSKQQAKVMSKNIRKQICLLGKLRGEKNKGVRVKTLTPLFLKHKKRGLSFHSGPFF
ncbi:hypothetical protein BM524_15985 [Alteromonas mediterranea]|uniref:Uncharacterized protein n=1 Tax=Alteromonas mediterranea TaxID=314275 RepID=A0AAC9NSJ7_9ALTE|nr:hypothetical protein BM524_15985 [Alteromonas mediterranea]